MKRTGFQKVVDIVSKEHDCYYEIIVSGDKSPFVLEWEHAARVFLLESIKKGFKVNGLYDFDTKIHEIDKEVKNG